MITYIYVKKVTRAAQYENVRLQVYRVKKNQPHFVGEVFYNSGSTFGDETEIFKMLRKQKLITKKVYNAHGGVYYWHMRDSHGLKIQQIGSHNTK